jgi:hypothetical protein
VLFGTVDIPGGAAAVVSDSTVAYVAATGNGIRVVDAADSSAPCIIGGIGTCSPTEVAYRRSSRIVYAHAPATFDGTIYAYDVGNPRSPSLMGTLTIGGAYIMALDSTCALVGTNVFGGRVVNVVDVSNARWMHVVATLAVGEPWGMAARMPYGYVTVDDKLVIVDLRTPTAPVIVSTLNLPGAGALCVGPPGYIYVAADSFLHAVNVSNPAAPAVENSIVTGYCLSLNSTSDYLVLAVWNVGVRTYSLANPSRPAQTGELRLDDPRKAWCGPGRFYVAAGDDGLLVAGPPR